MADSHALDTPQKPLKQGIITGRFVRNAWYAAAWAHEIEPGKILGRKILGEPIALFRTTEGRVSALQDRCPHRFAPLSLGRVVHGDKLQCLYHGLELDGSGACTTNPHPPGNLPARARVRSYPLVERHKMVWIWMGDAERDLANIPDFGVLDTSPALHVMALDRIMIKANYELIVDNLLDLSHTSFVHEGILGNADTVDSMISVEQDGDNVVVNRHAKNSVIPGMSALQWPGHPERVDKFTRIRWMAPSTLILRAGVCHVGASTEGGTGYHAIHILTPETERSTHYFFSGVRFGVHTDDPAANRELNDKVTAMRRFAFEEQDAPIIEAQQRNIDQAASPLEPINLSVDVGPVRYKRVLDRMLAAEG